MQKEDLNLGLIREINFTRIRVQALVRKAIKKVIKTRPEMALSYVDGRWPNLRLYLIQNTTLGGHFWSLIVTLVMQYITPV